MARTTFGTQLQLSLQMITLTTNSAKHTTYDENSNEDYLRLSTTMKTTFSNQLQQSPQTNKLPLPIPNKVHLQPLNIY